MRSLLTRSLLLLFLLAMIGSLINRNLSGAGAARGLADPNPLLAEWEGAYGGVPPFDKVQVALFKPALETAMAENLAEIDKIADNSTAPSFENTIVAMERA